MIPFEVEVVFLLPSALLDAAVKSLEVRILNVGASILHDHDESYQEGTLTDRVSQRLNQIPSEPLDMEDGVVPSDELGCEEAGQASNLHHVSTSLFSFDGCFLHLKSIKFTLGLQSQGLELEHLLSDNGVFEELSLIDECVANFIDRDAGAVG